MKTAQKTMFLKQYIKTGFYQWIIIGGTMRSLQERSRDKETNIIKDREMFHFYVFVALSYIITRDFKNNQVFCYPIR